jgi:NitT/TauT family transport system substrate-binding protein
MNRAAALAVLAALTLSLVAPVALRKAAAQAPSIPKLAAPVTVKIGLGGRPLSFAGLWVATGRGYFQEAGITNELVEVGGLNALIGPLATGELDLGTAGVGAALFNAIGRGVRLRIVADQHTASPGRSGVALMVRKDLADKVRTFADLRGRSIGITTRKASSEFVLLKGLRAVGLTGNDVNLIVMPFAQVNVALANGSLDAGFQIEPLVAAAVEKNIAVRWRGLDDVIPNLQNVFLVASESFMARTDVARAWMTAYLRGIRDYHDAITKGRDREAVIGILIQSTAVKDRATYDRMVMPGINPDGEVNVESIREALGELRAAGDIQGAVDLDRVVDLSHIKYAQRVLGRSSP